MGGQLYPIIYLEHKGVSIDNEKGHTFDFLLKFAILYGLQLAETEAVDWYNAVH